MKPHIDRPSPLGLTAPACAGFALTPRVARAQQKLVLKASDVHRLGEAREQARLLALIKDPIIARDLDDRITYWNHGA